MLVERSSAVLREPGNALYNPAAPPINVTTPPDDIKFLIKRTGNGGSELVIIRNDLAIPEVLVNKLTLSALRIGINMANVELPIHAPLSLTSIITPALSLDEAGYNTVYISRGGPCGSQDTFFLRPCHGGEIGVDVNAVSIGVNH